MKSSAGRFPRNAALTVVAAITLAACGEAGTPAGPRPQPVVVYASYVDQDYLPKLFEGFTEETGIPVTMRYANEQENVARVITNRGAPPADLLLVPTISGIWQAAEEGALIPQRSPVIDAAVPDWLRDPDHLWTATGFRVAVIAYDPEAIDPDSVSDYASLAEPAFEGSLCLTTAQLSVNRALIAMLIDMLGTRSAELLVRGWIRNLGHPVFEREADLLEAIADGRCGLGIVSSSAIAERGSGSLGIRVPDTASLDAEAAGIARHARHPDTALALIEWLVGKTAQQSLVAGNWHYPANPAAADPPALVAAGRANAATVNSWRVGRDNEEALKLAERAAYR